MGRRSPTRASIRLAMRTGSRRSCERRCVSKRRGQTPRRRRGWTFPRSWSVARRGWRPSSGPRRRLNAALRGGAGRVEEKLARRRDTEKATGKKARGREPKAPEPGPRAKDQVNFTDEESRIMPSSEGFVQGYNAQAAVDIDVAEHVSDHTNDKQALAPALRCLDERQEVVGQPRALRRCRLFQRRERQALRGRGNRALYREWSGAPPSAVGRAVSACAGVSRAGRWCRGDEASHEDPRRQSAVRQAQVHGGDGLWSGQGGDGVPTISSRARGGAVDAGVHGRCTWPSPDGGVHRAGALPTLMHCVHWWFGGESCPLKIYRLFLIVVRSLCLSPSRISNPDS